MRIAAYCDFGTGGQQDGKMAKTLSDQRELLLALYAGVAGLLLLGGFVYKEIRDYRERCKNPRLNFETKTPKRP